MVARKKRAKKSKKPPRHSKRVTGDVAEARRLLRIVEKSQAPFGESAPIFAELKAKIDRGQRLTVEQYERLLNLVKIAREWERGIEASARTEPEETLPG